MTTKAIKELAKMEFSKLAIDTATASVQAVSSYFTEQGRQRVSVLQVNLQMLQSEVMMNPGDVLLAERVDDAQAAVDMCIEGDSVLKSQAAAEQVKSMLKAAGEVGLKIAFSAARIYIGDLA
tara:strand:- start:5290 stop:5655 length:366 start_codon:yes stop_codon:yes gene_type:complete